MKHKLNAEDEKLIREAQSAISRVYDNVNFFHTVGAALRCKNGRIYVGVNVYSIHGACAEQVAIGTAVTNGETDFECIVAVRGKAGEEILPPCGNCRQTLSDYMPDCDVILVSDGKCVKVPARELLPYAGKVIV